MRPKLRALKAGRNTNPFEMVILRKNAHLYGFVGKKSVRSQLKSDGTADDVLINGS